MSFTRDNRLVLPGRDFEYDTDTHIRNHRLIELWSEQPKDIWPLKSQDTLPPPSEWRDGALVVVNDELYILKAGVWTPLMSSGTTVGGDLNGTLPNPKVNFVAIAKWGTD